MRFKRHIELEKGQLDIAPLIDIIFLLLIFFMLTSTFISQQGIRVNLPNAATGSSLSTEILAIFITDNDRLLINGKSLTFKELNTKIRMAAREKTHILIKADKKASLGKVVEIWDLCREAGIANINIATAPKD